MNIKAANTPPFETNAPTIKPQSVISDLKEGIKNWRTWWLLGKQDIISKYRRSVIGPFWITMTLIIFAFAMGLLYSQVFKQPFKEYVVYLVCGLTPWYLIQSFFLEGSTVAIESSVFLQNLPLRLSAFASRIVTRNLIIFAHNLIAVGVILLVLQWPVTFSILLIFPALAIYTVLGLGLSLLLGPVCARYRDLPQMIAALMQLLLFLSPIIWPPSLINSGAFAIRLNPFFHFIEIVRSPLLGKEPTLENWCVSGVSALLILGIGILSYSRTRKYIFYWI